MNPTSKRNDPRQPNIKRFPGDKNTPRNPDTFVMSGDGTPMIGVTTPEHIQAHAMTLEAYLRKVVAEATAYAESIFHKYGEDGEIGWFPCGTANVVLHYNDEAHREIIKLFRKEGIEDRKTWWQGWFGRLYKTGGQGWWWTVPMPASQSMAYEEAVCQFVRDKLIYRDIKVNVRTYID